MMPVASLGGGWQQRQRGDFAKTASLLSVVDGKSYKKSALILFV